ncbi:MAG: phosphatidylglycerophosphatase A [Phycisphaerae bacterium]|nr:phosphatidylglycerophosphatase A [Phycisphaerae bacterium]
MTAEPSGQEEAPSPDVATRTGLPDRVVLFIGSLAYLGFVPAASGTVAVAVVGVPLYLALAYWLKIGWGAYAAFVVVFTLLSVWIADRTDKVLGEEDSRKNVIDELPGYLVAVFALPVTWQVVVAAFFLERAIDIVKVWPARWIERRVPGGWGVVLDDVVAGLYTLGLLHLGVYVVPQWFGVGA